MSLAKKYSQVVALKLVPKFNPKIRKEGAYATILHLPKLFSPPVGWALLSRNEAVLPLSPNFRGRVTLISALRCSKRNGHAKKKFSFVKELTKSDASFIRKKWEKFGLLGRQRGAKSMKKRAEEVLFKRSSAAREKLLVVQNVVLA